MLTKGLECVIFSSNTCWYTSVYVCCFDTFLFVTFLADYQSRCGFILYVNSIYSDGK